MFWACFSGDIKGPAIFWEKDWGTINQESYQQHIPCTGGYLRAWQKNSWRRNHQQHHHYKIVNYFHYYIV